MTHAGLPRTPLIRRFRAADHAGLLRFLERTLTDLGFHFEPEGKDSDVRDLESAYLLGGGSFHVVDLGGEILGSVGVRRFSPEVAELKRLYLAPELRGRGLGHGLCATAMADARELGYRRLRLDTTRRSAAAIALFGKLGFRDIDRYNANPDAELFMEYAL